MKPKKTQRALLLALLPIALLTAYALRGAAEPLPPPSSSATPTTVLPVSTRTFESAIRVTGEVTATHGSPAVVAEAAGKVAGVAVAVGDSVTAGQLLAWLEPTDAQAKLREAQAEAARLQAQWDESRRQADEQRQLAAKDYVSPSEFARFKAQEATSHELVQAAKARLDAARAGARRMEVFATYAGTIARRNVQPGDYARAGDTLFEISQPSSTELALAVPESAADRIQVGTKVRVWVAGHPLVTAVSRVQPAVESASRSFRVYTPNPAPHQLIRGRSATAQLVTETTEAIAVPEAGVVLEGEHLAVFVIRDNRAHKRAVTRVAQRGGYLGVEGLQRGERIAVSGAAFLRDGAEVVEVAP